ncbi:MAG: hypothetical protein M4D85_04175, partial [Actinomycetota bacterium]|nr:hypothetical protein [Actinomycetota bacterium]
MSEQPPSHPLFDQHLRRGDDDRDEPRLDLDAARERLQEYRRRTQEGPLPDFKPALLIRALPGDRGVRPLSSPFWESPDIWSALGAPDGTPAVPATPGGAPVAGQPNTLYAHVWNLGLAPVLNAVVEFFVFDPSLSFGTQAPLFSATATVDLSGRSAPQTCHRLVKCPVPWVPTIVNGGHECIVVRVSAMGDAPAPAHVWDAWADRRVAQRNIGVVAAGTGIKHILKGLQFSRREHDRIELLQIGPEAQHVLDLTLPQAHLDPRVQTHVLAELGPRGDLTIPPTRLTDAPSPAGRGPRRITISPQVVPRVDLGAVLSMLTERTGAPSRTVPLRARRTGRIPLIARGGSLEDLLSHAGRLADVRDRQ